MQQICRGETRVVHSIIYYLREMSRHQYPPDCGRQNDTVMLRCEESIFVALARLHFPTPDAGALGDRHSAALCR